MDFPGRADPPSLLYNAVFPGSNAAGEWANHTVRTAQASSISRSVLLPLLYSCVACSRTAFTFTTNKYEENIVRF